MSLHTQSHVQIARRSPAHARLTFATDPDLRPGVDSGWNPHGEPPGPLEASLTAALCTRIFEQPSGASAGRACRGGDHRAKDRLTRAPDLSRPATAGTCLLAAAGLRAAARTVLARREARDIDLPLDADERLFERDRHVVAKVVAAIGPLSTRAAATAAEERVEDVRERHVREVDGRSSAALDGRMAEHVVGPPAPGIGQNRVSLARLFETGRRRRIVRIAVRMRVHGYLPERSLQVFGRCLAAHAEDLVVVAFDGHAWVLTRSLFAVRGGVGVWAGKRPRASHLHQRRPDDAVAHSVAPAKLLDDGILRIVVGVLMADRLVVLRVEWRTYRLDRLESKSGERLLKLAHAELETLRPGVIDAGRGVIECLLQIVQTWQEPRNQLRRSVLDRVDLFLARSSLVVVEIGRQAQVAGLWLRCR